MRERIVGHTTLTLLLGDITRQETDAVVNAANAALAGGGGVDGAIHRGGGPSIMDACRKIGGCPTGDAVMTTAGALPSRYVIHAVAPRWAGGERGEPRLLASAYRRSLELADEHRLRTVAFPSLGTGAYRYPLDEAARIALETVDAHLRGGTGIEQVRFVLFDEAALRAYERALAALPGPPPAAPPIDVG